MILKILLVAGVIAFVYFIFIKKKPAVTKNRQNTTNKKTKEEVESNDMIECAECGIYCEIDDAILSNNKYFCSQECLKKV